MTKCLERDRRQGGDNKRRHICGHQGRSKTKTKTKTKTGDRREGGGDKRRHI